MSVNPNENSTLVHEGIAYRKVSRKANVGEVVLIVRLDTDTDCDVDFGIGDVVLVSKSDATVDFIHIEESGFEVFDYEYVVLEPVENTLTLTEADVRNNPRQVIDMFTSLALNQTKLEAKIERLASAYEQAISTVARNVETWGQEVELTKEAHEELKRKVAGVDERTQPYQQAHELFVKIAGGMNGRDLTAEERREL
jgi:hypothetical protein